MVQIRRMRWVLMWQVWRRREVRTGFLWGNLNEGDHFEDLGIDGRIILKLLLKKRDGRV
jgi:hypothetical protein